MDLPSHATKKSFQIFSGISAFAFLALLIPLYLTGGTLPRPVERSAAPAKVAASSAKAEVNIVSSPSGTTAAPAPEVPPVLEAVYTVDVFDPERDADADLAATIERATAENKRILLQIGGNWCVWTRSMDVFFAENEAVATALGRDFLIMKVNFSDANENFYFLDNFTEITALPHFLLLDPSGNLIHSQHTEEFEKGNSYDEEALVAFLTDWATREPEPEPEPEPDPEPTENTKSDPAVEASSADPEPDTDPKSEEKADPGARSKDERDSDPESSP